jgi:MYXO-CTERM domain-containing protein
VVCATAALGDVIQSATCTAGATTVSGTASCFAESPAPGVSAEASSGFVVGASASASARMRLPPFPEEPTDYGSATASVSWSEELYTLGPVREGYVSLGLGGSEAGGYGGGGAAGGAVGPYSIVCETEDPCSIGGYFLFELGVPFSLSGFADATAGGVEGDGGAGIFESFQLYEALTDCGSPPCGPDLSMPVSVLTTPEPSTAPTVLLGALGMLGLASWRRRLLIARKNRSVL